MTDNIPKELDGWTIGKCLGKGSCGGVYEATKNGLEAACKLVRNKSFAELKKTKEPYIHAYLENEGIVLTHTQRFHIPYLPRMHQACKTLDGWRFIVIEKFGKGSLAEYAQKNTPLAAPYVFGIGWRLVKCLQAFHGANWLHLDIKPENVLIADDPKRGIAVIDFGMSLGRGYAKDYPRTVAQGTYAFLGSHAWAVKPEHPRDDLESAGLTMAWLMRGGNLPWTARSKNEMKHAITDPTMPSTVTNDATIQDYLTRVRNLKDDESPNYDELLDLLALRAGDCLEYLDLPYSPVSMEAHVEEQLQSPSINGDGGDAIPSPSSSSAGPNRRSDRIRKRLNGKKQQSSSSSSSAGPNRRSDRIRKRLNEEQQSSKPNPNRKRRKTKQSAAKVVA